MFLRWKCLLWYLPNVPPNHGMLQRLRPEPMNSVRVGSPELVEHAPCEITGTTEPAQESSPTPSISKASSSQLPAAPAEQLVTSREDTFELFDRDGPGSAIHVYEAKKQPATA